MIQQQEQALIAAFKKMESAERLMLLDLACRCAKQANNAPTLRLIVNDNKKQ